MKGDAMGANRDPTVKAPSIQELKSQKRKQEGRFQERISPVTGSRIEPAAVADPSDPALQRFLQLAKHDSEHKRSKIRALKEGTANVTSAPSRPGVGSKQTSFRQVAYSRPGFSKASSFKQMSMSDHPRSQRLAHLHQFFEWGQIHTPNKSLKKRASRRQMLSSQSERHRSTPVLDVPIERSKTEENWKSKQRSKHRRSSRKVEVKGLQESVLLLVQSKSNSPREEGSVKSRSSGLAKYLEKDRAKGKHGSIQDFIERSVASEYSYDTLSDLRPAPKMTTSNRTTDKADLLQSFTEKYKALQSEQMKKTTTALGPKISV